ncbi:MAG TPA: hypothetical protein DD420_02225 [Streptomyces sp.]|nr:hypothetical protein [Streptomyces sp.]
MNRKYMVLPAVLVVAAAVVAVVQLWPSTLKDLRAKNLCLGMLTEETAGLLHDGKGGALAVDEGTADGSASDPVFTTTCFVNRDPEGSAAQRLQYALVVRPANALGEPAEDAVPVGHGHSGWIGPRESEVQLPDSCARPMRTSAPHITVTLKIAPGTLVKEDGKTFDLISKSRTVLLECIDNLTRQYDCAG